MKKLCCLLTAICAMACGCSSPSTGDVAIVPSSQTSESSSSSTYEHTEPIASETPEPEPIPSSSEKEKQEESKVEPSPVSNTNNQSQSSNESTPQQGEQIISPSTEKQSVDLVTLREVNSVMLSIYMKGRYDITEMDSNPVERSQSFFDQLPLTELSAIDKPSTFDEITAIQVIGGDAFDYFWYIHPDCTLLRKKSGEEYYTTSSQNLFDTLYNLPETHPELFDQVDNQATIDENGKINPTLS